MYTYVYGCITVLGRITRLAVVPCSVCFSVILYLSFSVCKSLHSKEAMASGVIPAAPARALATPIPEQSPLAVTRLQQCVSWERGSYILIGRFGINSTLCSLAQPS